MILDFIKTNRYYLLSLLVLMLVFFLCKWYFIEDIIKIDEDVSYFIQNHIVNDNFTHFFQIITNMGGVFFFVVVLIIILILTYKKKIFSTMSINLGITYLVSVIFKNVFVRERPIYSLIEKPSDYSFPSGHTMCSVAFYGFSVYLINKYVKNKWVKLILDLIIGLVLVLVGFSRLYLNVHYLTDVICGGVLGLICLIMFVRYVKIKKVI